MKKVYVYRRDDIANSYYLSRYIIFMNRYNNVYTVKFCHHIPCKKLSKRYFIRGCTLTDTDDKVGENIYIYKVNYNLVQEYTI